MHKKEELLKSAQAIAISHNLISQGLFQGQAVKDIQTALDFLSALHQTVMAELEPMLEAEANTPAPQDGSNDEQKV